MKETDKKRLAMLAEIHNMSIDDTIDALVHTQCIAFDISSGSMCPTPLAYLAGHFDKTGVTTTTQLVQTTETHEVFIAYFDGNLMKFYKNISTGEIGADVDALATTLGFESAHDLLSQDKSLDLLNEAHKQTGVWPINTIRL